LETGDSLIVHSDRNSLQRVLLEGNITNTTISKPREYPADNLAIKFNAGGTITLRAFFDYANDYEVTVATQSSNSNLQHANSTYYISQGSFELDITVFVNESNAPTQVPTLSPSESFLSWMSKFGEAFPFWVKALYLVLGIQFFTVGGLWIRRQTARKEEGPQPLDYGDKAFLWIDLAYKFLLVSFLAIILIMGGELLGLFILRFMFLVSLDLLSLWDLFVVGFAAGALIIVYLARFTLERAFDLKPIEDE